MDSQTKYLDKRILYFSKDSFEELALEIFSYQFDRNENYRKFCLLEKKTPSTVSHWKEIPAMPTRGFKELVLATFPIKNAVRIFKTSGTSAGFKGAHFFETLKLYEAAVLPPFRQYLLPDEANLDYFFLMPPSKEAPFSSLSFMMDVIQRKIAKAHADYYVKKETLELERLLGDLRKQKTPVLLAATAFALKIFLDFLKSKKVSLKLPPKSRLMETGGFKGRIKEISKKMLYQECQKRLGIQKNNCVSEYGMTELSSQFYDTTLFDAVERIQRTPVKMGPAWTKTLVIDPRTGREARKGARGLLRHFDLANRGSVMAIQTEDAGRAAGEGFELLGRARGSELRGCSLEYEDFLKS